MLMISARRQRGSIAPFMVLALGGALLATAYAIDTSRMVNSASQVKRATDLAALAVGQERLGNGEKSLEEFKKLAYGYVVNNLGLDSTLATQIDEEALTLSEQKGDEGRTRYRVEVTLQADAELLGAEPRFIQVHSTVEVQPSALEVALALPNSGSENESNLQVLRRQSMRFAQKLVEGRDDAWLALVPYSQTVNVSPDYTNPQTRAPAGPSGNHAQRLNSWAMANALRPIELTSLFRSGYAGLHDRRIPDRRANLLCMYRGLNRGDNYFWDQAPAGQFRIYYRHDLPENGSPGATPIRWVGPNPIFGQATGTNDTRWMVADKGCPSAPLLPLSNDINKIEERLEQMSTRFNVNYAIAMGWSAMALAPAFRGSSGWNLPDELPKDFKEDGGDSYKAIVMLVNTTGQRWFDSDSYNADTAQAIDGETGTDGENQSLRTQRFARLCDSFRERKLRFFLIAIGQDEIENNDLGAEDTTIDGASDFRRLAGPGLARCTEQAGDITYLPGFDFVAAEGRLQNRLDAILDDIRRQGSYVRLVE
ncbi:Putative Flp pilus-assembly TadE/G-like [Pseudomonas cuatrocienegasensis]|uniref:Flp pilus-assembly TadE/G-like n=1 Tax=Pseudomonas cuatrocienegasensis TaxID=543360 RepID=A0ABY1BKQ8_9PSED|nr:MULTISPECIES: Tad domain-containing protein [Pseudomonas]OEC34804.1 hypothetical protein A7D25_11905 [Pseudomonas sp. 21C1]SER06397.1 Putative Flp pilus-assembly TadE/G-like [Pseudomonas cuatrocienegasensis]